VVALRRRWLTLMLVLAASLAACEYRVDPRCPEDEGLPFVCTERRLPLP
jgi:hypothetical protein